MAAPDRYEVNRRIRTILIRYDVDLSKIDYSFIGNTVYLYGELQKSQRGEFNAANIDQMIREISRIEFVRYINLDLKNWTVTYAGRSVNVEKKKAAAPVSQDIVAGEVAPKDEYVDLDEEREREMKKRKQKETTPSSREE